MTPEPPVKSVKNAHSVAAAMAVPPGIQPKHARNTRSRRSDDRPSASKNPASVKSGIAANPVDVVSSSDALISSTIGFEPATRNANTATPPSSVKIGAPSTPAISTTISHGKSDWPSIRSRC